MADAETAVAVLVPYSDSDDSSGDEGAEESPQDKTNAPVEPQPASVPAAEAPTGDGGCVANSFRRAKISGPTHTDAATDLDAQIDPVLAELRAGGRATTRDEVGIEGQVWHPRCLARAAWCNGYRLTKLDLGVVDLRSELKTGTLLVEGTLNKVCYKGKCPIDK